MSLAKEFNASGAQGSDYGLIDFKSVNNGVTLYLRQSGGGAFFHFHTRTMHVSSGSAEGGMTVIPFSQLDPEVLELMRDKLIELGGKPPSLPTVFGKPSPIGKNTP